MSDYHIVAREGDIAPGEARVVAVGDRTIAVFNVAGVYRAIDDVCPHRGASLAEGFVEDGAVTCPLHAWCFDLETGKMVGGIEGLATVDVYDVRVADGEIAVAPEPRAAN